MARSSRSRKASERPGRVGEGTGLVVYIEAREAEEGARDLARSLAWALRIAAQRGPGLSLLLSGDAPGERGQAERIEWLDLEAAWESVASPGDDPKLPKGHELRARGPR